MNSPSSALEELQIEKLNCVLGELWERNPFYTSKWCEAGVTAHRLTEVEELRLFPFTTRGELLHDQQSTPPLGANLTCPHYLLKRIHRSSGTTRAPLYWADTPKSWAWVMRCSEALFLIAGITPDDRLLFLVPFGQSSGPWIMYEGACKLGCSCFTSNPRDIEDQIQSLRFFRPTVLMAKPSHLLHLSFALESAGTPPGSLGVQKLIFIGEPASQTARHELEKVWNAAAFDRYGLTEAGPVASECPAHPGGMHLLETEFVAEVIEPDASQPVAEGALGELVLTTLGRISRPIVRYRTGDLVRLIRDHRCPCNRVEALLVGGVWRTTSDVLPKGMAGCSSRSA